MKREQYANRGQKMVFRIKNEKNVNTKIDDEILRN